MKLGFYIDSKGCYGCKTCSVACAQEKQLPDEVYIRQVKEIKQDSPNKSWSFMSLSCNHCDNPVCVEACPVGAYSKLENGIVIQNHEACIGCQSCIDACPYKAPQFAADEKKVYKCDLCRDRLERNENPACVNACPGRYIEFGDIEELKKKHPDAVSDVKDYLPDSSITKANLLVDVEEALTKRTTVAVADCCQH